MYKCGNTPPWWARYQRCKFEKQGIKDVSIASQVRRAVICYFAIHWFGLHKESILTTKLTKLKILPTEIARNLISNSRDIVTFAAPWSVTWFSWCGGRERQRGSHCCRLLQTIQKSIHLLHSQIIDYWAESALWGFKKRFEEFTSKFLNIFRP